MTNKNTARMFFIVLVTLLIGVAASAVDDIEAHRFCKACGMDRKAYGFSRMLICYENGIEVGVCSLHCAVRELDESKGRAVKALLVADRDSRTLINTEQAIWVLGGTKRGVMTNTPSWAFATLSSADAFVAKFGGNIVPWSKVLAAAQ